jgi:hypothetical protein
MQEIEMKVLPLDHPDKGMDFNYSIRTGWLSDGKFSLRLACSKLPVLSQCILILAEVMQALSYVERARRKDNNIHVVYFQFPLLCKKLCSLLARNKKKRSDALTNISTVVFIVGLICCPAFRAS